MTETEQERLAGITQSFDQSARRFEDAGRRLGTTEADDPDGVVSVILTRRGQLSAVRIENDWESVVGTDGLGQAVVSAYLEAVTARAEAYTADAADPTAAAGAEAAAPGAGSSGADADAAQVADIEGVAGIGSPDEVAETTRTRSIHMQEAVHEALRDRGDSVPDEVMFAGLLNFMEEFETALDLAVAQTESLVATTVEGSSGSGRVTATVSLAGDLQALDYDRSWAPGAHPFNLSRETVEAVSDGLRRAALRAAEGTELADFQQLSSDPQRLLGHLRLS